MENLPKPLVEHLNLFLDKWNQGDRDAIWEALPHLYKEIHRRAKLRLTREQNRDVLQTTALTHEVFLRLAGSGLSFRDNVHFLAMCASMMNWIVVDYARQRRRQGKERVAISTGWASDDGVRVDILDLNVSLERLRETHPDLWMVIVLQTYGELTHKQIATCVGTSERTVRRWLEKAKRLLLEYLTG